MRCRHCEERSDEAIQGGGTELDCFAPLAMTKSQRLREACQPTDASGTASVEAK
jgi:hypothetical protein